MIFKGFVASMKVHMATNNAYFNGKVIILWPIEFNFLQAYLNQLETW